MTRKKMNISMALVFFLSCIIWLGCEDDSNPINNDSDFAAEEPFFFAIEVTDQVRLNLEGVAGTIDITGVPQCNSVVITGKRRVESNSTQDAEERLQELQVQVRDLTNEISVKTIQPSDTEGRNYIVNYAISLPANFEVQVVDVSGNVTVNAIQNVVRVNSVSGNVKLNQIFGNAFVESVSGSITSEITLTADGTVKMQAVSGHIGLDVPANTSATFSATVVSGQISVSNLTLENVVNTPTSLQGTCGDGNGTIILNTVSGNISISGF